MKLSKDALYRWQTLIIRYGVYVLLNTLITQTVITYVLGISQVAESALTSFPFFCEVCTNSVDLGDRDAIYGGIAKEIY